MKRLAALALSGIIIISGAIPLKVEATTSAEAIMDEVIGKVMEEKNKGNTIYYDLMIRYKDQIDKETLGLLYNTMLTSEQKLEIEKRYGDVTTELNNLSDTDIQKLKGKVDAVAPSGNGKTPIGGGETPGVTPKENNKIDEKSTEVEIPKKEESKEEKPVIKVSFKDISSLWIEAQDAVNFMANRGVLQGKSEGLFAPYDSITRAEFSKTIVSLLNLKNDTAVADKSFKDVAKGQWYYDYVQIAYKHGIIEGKNKDIFAPNELITREEMAVMISRTIRLMKKSEILLPLQAKEMLQSYKDSNQISDWAELDMALVVKNKIIQGKDGKYIAPKDNATRSEAVVILKRLYSLLNN